MKQQEWTYERVRSYDIEYQRLADDINAALSDEQTKVRFLEKNMTDTCFEKGCQLAAEREEKERWQDEYARKVTEHENTKSLCDWLNDQLAAERERNAKLQVALTTEQQNADSFCKQLAAERERVDKNADVIEATALELHDEREKVQTLVDALKYRVKIWLRRGGDEHWNSHMQNAYKECANELTAALAKVEGK